MTAVLFPRTPEPAGTARCARNSRSLLLHFLLLLASLLFAAIPLPAQDASAMFDAANKLYEQGRFPEAAAAYEKIGQSGQRSETLYFNLGNAWFKAGQLGRAIAAWRLGESIAPRDPSLRFNLQFARKKVSGNDSAPNPAWQRALTTLTLNEWTVIAAAAGWLWFLLLALREVRPNLRNGLSGYTATAGVTALLLAGCVAAAANLRFNTLAAVVVVPEAIARSGPLEEAKVLHQFRDGIELIVVDQKDLTLGNQTQTWLQVRDSANRTGWLRSDQVTMVKLGVYRRATIVDDRKNLVAGQPECREYTFQYVDNDEPAGEVSDIVRVITSRLMAA